VRILLVSARREAIHPFAEGLSSNPEVLLKQVDSGAEALRAVRTGAPQLLIVDEELPDMEPLHLVRELLGVNAMVNTAVVSSLPDQEFHEATEGLGILTRLPSQPVKDDAVELLHQLKQLLMSLRHTR
jgi:DNA-binding response OmpR family regulator